jgi:hypothetical protein
MPYATISNSWPATVELNGTNCYYIVCAAPESSRLFKVFIESADATPPTLDVRALSIDGVPLTSTLAGKLNTNGLTAPIIAAAGGLTNAAAFQPALTNSTTFQAGVYLGTNGVFFTPADGTNRWILF